MYYELYHMDCGMLCTCLIFIYGVETKTRRAKRTQQLVAAELKDAECYLSFSFGGNSILTTHHFIQLTASNIKRTINSAACTFSSTGQVPFPFLRSIMETATIQIKQSTDSIVSDSLPKAFVPAANQITAANSIRTSSIQSH